ncbi:MAG: ribonuclease HII [Chloroflexi bacterium]|nr:ribonuclease HII [Chloroflexota bacterium]MCI0577847.1 ribonuclease HII [Chloroflexota bacterium]MCI0643829.1 ribonuclease HII [Chloroflexota bacterium]MCI0726073.1 ribonuclease HII [Chloroflexota bacterium]
MKQKSRLASISPPATTPHLELEMAAYRELGLTTIAGVDEAGRGAIAGPVVAAAVILPLEQPHRLAKLHAVRDSKQLTARQRAALYDLILEQAVAWGVGRIPAEEIDCIGILPANFKAMRLALAQLDPTAQYLLLDGPLRLPGVTLPQQAVVRGDNLSLTIAAASIVAKVTRDREMTALDTQYPLYGFASHKGYCTAGHQANLTRHGPCPIHRHTFAPICQVQR